MVMISRVVTEYVGQSIGQCGRRRRHRQRDMYNDLVLYVEIGVRDWKVAYIATRRRAVQVGLVGSARSQQRREKEREKEEK